jgi:hypothetical protein
MEKDKMHTFDMQAMRDMKEEWKIVREKKRLEKLK